MLDLAVKFLAGEVNRYLARQTATDAVQVLPGVIVDSQGKDAFEDANIRITLINVEEERVLRSQVPDRVFVNGSHLVLQPEVKLNLHILFATRPSKSFAYDAALRYLSYILLFFQSHPTFTADEYPALGPSIPRLNVELLSYGPEQLNQLWAYLGAKYLPSVVYRVRMVIVQDREPKAIEQPITSIEMGVQAT